MAGLLDPAPELLEGIILKLDMLDILACVLSSQTLCEIVQGSVDIQYLMALERSGRIDNPHCSMAVSDKLKKLETAEFRWSSRPFIPPIFTGEGRLKNYYQQTDHFDFNDEYHIHGARESDSPHQNSTHIIYTPFMSSVNVDGMFAKLDTPPEDYIIAAPKILDGARILGFATNVEEHGIDAVIYGRIVDDPSIMSLDLVVTYEEGLGVGPRHWASLCGLQVNGAGDLASIDITANIEICGENLAFVLCIQDEEELIFLMLVVDWRSGDVKTQSLRCGSPRLAFLAEDLLLIPNTFKAALDIYHIPSTASMKDSDDPSTAPAVSLVHSLLLPELEDGNAYVHLAALCSPNPFGANPRARTKEPTYRPFITDPEKSIIATTVKIENSGIAEGGEREFIMYRMIVHRQSLLDSLSWRHLRPDVIASRGRPHQDRITQAPWQEWGPPIARWIPVQDPDFVRRFCSYGHRFTQLVSFDLRGKEPVDPSETPEKDLVHHVALLYDFNPWTVKILKQNQFSKTHSKIKLGRNEKISNQMPFRIVDSKPSESQSFSQIESTQDNFHIRGKDIFKQGPPTSHLPYVEYDVYGLPDASEIHIDANRITQRKMEDFTDLSIACLYFG